MAERAREIDRHVNQALGGGDLIPSFEQQSVRGAPIINQGLSTVNNLPVTQVILPSVQALYLELEKKTGIKARPGQMEATSAFVQGKVVEAANAFGKSFAQLMAGIHEVRTEGSFASQIVQDSTLSRQFAQDAKWPEINHSFQEIVKALLGPEASIFDYDNYVREYDRARERGDYNQMRMLTDKAARIAGSVKTIVVSSQDKRGFVPLLHEEGSPLANAMLRDRSGLS